MNNGITCLHCCDCIVESTGYVLVYHYLNHLTYRFHRDCFVHVAGKEFIPTEYNTYECFCCGEKMPAGTVPVLIRLIDFVYLGQQSGYTYACHPECFQAMSGLDLSRVKKTT